ncbi:MAG: helix-turn-helix domain-containing protein [Candidatus Bathyarchaeia archaeon]
MGLTTRQAEVYLSIAKLGQITVKEIAQDLQVARAEIYCAIPELQRRGLIQKIVSTPVTFKATPLSEGIAILLQQNLEKYKSIRKEAKQFLRQFDQHKENRNQESAQYYLTLGLRTVSREYLRDLQNTREKKDCILEWKGIVDVVNRDFDYLEEALERGVKVRYITGIPKGEKMPQSIRLLTEKGFFKIKITANSPQAGLDIFDEEIVHFINVPNSNPKKIEVLRVHNPAIAKLAQDYFELKWQAATAPLWR